MKKMSSKLTKWDKSWIKSLIIFKECGVEVVWANINK